MASVIGSLTSKLFKNFTSLSNYSKSTATSSLLKSVTSSQGLYHNVSQTRFVSAFKQFENLPPVNRMAGKGNTYETEVKRKRKIRDPNKPNFVHIEPLKWATWPMLRDVRRRYIFRDYYFERVCLKSLSQNRTLPQSVRESAFDRRQNVLPWDSQFSHLRNRCAITGRTRSALKRYRLSRLCWRNLADYNKLSGVIKASWG